MIRDESRMVFVFCCFLPETCAIMELALTAFGGEFIIANGLPTSKCYGGEGTNSSHKQNNADKRSIHSSSRPIIRMCKAGRLVGRHMLGAATQPVQRKGGG